jgi:hypothetical protein
MIKRFPEHLITVYDSIDRFNLNTIKKTITLKLKDNILFKSSIEWDEHLRRELKEITIKTSHLTSITLKVDYQGFNYKGKCKVNFEEKSELVYKIISKKLNQNDR